MKRIFLTDIHIERKPKPIYSKARIGDIQVGTTTVIVVREEVILWLEERNIEYWNTSTYIVFNDDEDADIFESAWPQIQVETDQRTSLVRSWCFENIGDIWSWETNNSGKWIQRETMFYFFTKENAAYFKLVWG